MVYRFRHYCPALDASTKDWPSIVGWTDDRKAECVLRILTMVASKLARMVSPRSTADMERLEAAWHDALASSLSYFRALLQSSNSSAWKPVQVLPLTSSTTAHDAPSPSTSQRKLGSISAGDVKVCRRSGKNGEVFRAVAEVDCGPDVGIEDFRGCLVTPETRPMCTLVHFD